MDSFFVLSGWISEFHPQATLPPTNMAPAWRYLEDEFPFEGAGARREDLFIFVLQRFELSWISEFGYGSKLNYQGTAGSSFHVSIFQGLPHFGVALFLTTTAAPNHSGHVQVAVVKK